MARRHKHLVGFRILLVIAIPTMYFLCVSLAGLFGEGDRNDANQNRGHSPDLISEFKKAKKNFQSRKILREIHLRNPRIFPPIFNVYISL